MRMEHLIIVRGAGDISTGTIHRLFRAGFPVLALESERPSAIRRRVAFSEAVYDGSATVERVTAVRVADIRDAAAALGAGKLPLLVDPNSVQDIADKMKMLLTDNTLRQSIAEKGYRYATDNFSPKVLADRLMEVYNKLV